VEKEKKILILTTQERKKSRKLSQIRSNRNSSTAVPFLFYLFSQYFLSNSLQYPFLLLCDTVLLFFSSRTIRSSRKDVLSRSSLSLQTESNVID